MATPEQHSSCALPITSNDQLKECINAESFRSILKNSAAYQKWIELVAAGGYSRVARWSPLV